MLRKLFIVLSWLTLLLVEIAIFIAASMVAQHYIFAGFEALGWTPENDAAMTVSIFAGLFIGIALSFFADYLAKRWTGLSPLKDVGESFPFIP